MAQEGQDSPSRRGGRPTLARVEAINQAILAVARRYFLSAGVEATAMENIAAEAGVSKGTLYARYPTKESLLKAVVEDLVAAIGVQTDLRQGPIPEDFKDRLRYFARSIIDNLDTEDVRALQRVIANSSEAGGELAQSLHEAGHLLAIKGLAEEIRRGTRDHPVPPRNPERVAEMFMAMLTGWYDAHHRVRKILPQEAASYVDHVVDVIFAGRSAW